MERRQILWCSYLYYLTVHALPQNTFYSMLPVNHVPMFYSEEEILISSTFSANYFNENGGASDYNHA